MRMAITHGAVTMTTNVMAITALSIIVLPLSTRAAGDTLLQHNQFLLNLWGRTSRYRGTDFEQWMQKHLPLRWEAVLNS